MCLILFILPLAKESLSAKWKWLESKNRIKKKKKDAYNIDVASSVLYAVEISHTIGTLRTVR